jgi:protoporphyrinogen oxidase
MKIGIIGAGFGGLAAAYQLAKAGNSVVVLEAGKLPGGLAVGFKEKKWEWSLEKHYHHWFTNDEAVLGLAKEIGHEVLIKRPKTSTFSGDKIYQLDSPLNLLTFDQLKLPDRIRTGMILGYLKYLANWKNLEKVTAKEFLFKTMGKSPWSTLWEPLFVKKFGSYVDKISAAWFWARIKKRTPSLAYPAGGFLAFSEHLAYEIRRYKGKIYYSSPVRRIEKKGNKIEVKTLKSKYLFDSVICTLPSYVFLKVTKSLPQEYIENLLKAESLGAVNLLLSLKHKFFEDNTYWLNVNKKHFPFVAIVEHTNFMDRKYYNNEHLLYVGNYLPQNHPYFQKNEVQLLAEFYPFLKTINPKFDKSWINDAFAFKDFYAQPVIPINYSEMIPSFKTPLPGVFLSNMQQVYPWDRGTNYAIENGEKVAEMVLKSQ